MSKDLILVILSLMTWGIGEGMFLFFQAPYLEQLGADPLEIGRILGLVSTAMAITHLPAGYLSDRFGRRPMIYAAWTVGVVAAWVMALSNSLIVFVTGAVMYGFTGFVMTPLNSYITAARGTQSVGRALTLISATFSFGAIIGPWLGGEIGNRFGLRTNFLVAACFFVASTLIILFIKPQPVEAVEKQSSSLPANSWLNARFVLFLGLIFFSVFSMMLPQPFSQLFLLNERDISLDQLGRLISLSSLGVVLLNLTLGKLNPRIGFLISQAAMAVFAFILFRTNHILWFSVGYFFLGSYRTARSLATAQGRELVQAAHMGVAYGLIETVGSFANILAPIAASMLYNNQPSSVYSVSFVAILISLGLMLFFSPLRSSKTVVELD